MLYSLQVFEILVLELVDEIFVIYWQVISEILVI